MVIRQGKLPEPTSLAVATGSERAHIKLYSALSVTPKANSRSLGDIFSPLAVISWLNGAAVVEPGAGLFISTVGVTIFSQLLGKGVGGGWGWVERGIRF